MKLYGFLCIVIAVIMLVTPLTAVFPNTETNETASESVSGETQESEPSVSSAEDADTISVFMTASEEVDVLNMRDYIIGSVAAEMPASYAEEALKAQALAAITFAEYSKANGGDSSIGGADLSDDSSLHQGYMTTQEMQKKWGETYESYYEKIAAAVDAVLDKVITYEGEPIMAAYHAISSGRTESAENIWGKAVAYLVSVESEGDKYSSRYSSEASFTAKELKKALADVDDVDFSDDEENWISIKERTDAGTVTGITVCGKSMTGMELRALLSLRSPSFDVDYEDGTFTFHVSGYGHGVGMSQYGADWYARQGMTCEEIIAHYYPGTKIEDRTVIESGNQ